MEVERDEKELESCDQHMKARLRTRHKNGRTCKKYGPRRQPMRCGFAVRERELTESSTYCSLEDQDGGPPFMQDDPVW